MNTENTITTVQDLEGARKLGRLSKEVRVRNAPQYFN